MKNKGVKLLFSIGGVIMGFVLISAAILEATIGESNIVAIMGFTSLGIMMLTIFLMLVYIYTGIEKPTYEECRRYFLGSNYESFEK